MESSFLDQTRDHSGSELHRLMTLFPPPDFVKQASREQTHGDSQALPLHVYADVRNRLYPTHTAPATWVSTLFFLDKQANYSDADRELIDGRLRSAAKFFGIDGQLAVERVKVASAARRELSDLPDDAFALVWVAEDGTKDRKFPLRNAEEVKVAADYFGQYLTEFIFEDRNRIANRLLEKASQYDVNLGELAEGFEKTAGWGTAPVDDVVKEVTQRAAMLRVKYPEHAAALVKIAETLQADHNYVRNHQTMYKLACTLDMVDREFHLQPHYGNRLQCPEDALFGVTEKVARAFMSDHLVTTTGNVYAMSDMEKLGADTLTSWMGSDFADAVGAGGLIVDLEKLAEVVPTLDRGAASMFDKMLASIKVHPVMQEKQATDAPLAGDNLLKRAAARLQPSN